MKWITLLLIALVAAAAAAAHTGEDFTTAEQLIESKVRCSELNDGQLEMIGDYYMEQMHPGELHEVMEKQMGGDGSEQVRQAHLGMAKSFYCGDETAMPASMMNMMIGRDGHGMMTYGTWSGWNLNETLITLLLLLLIALAIAALVRLLRSGKKRKR